MLEIRQALVLAVILNGLGSFYAAAVGLQVAPWRSFLLGLSTGLLANFALRGAGFDGVSISIIGVALPAVMAVGIELSLHRTFVRNDQLVVRYGVIGNREESFPISEVRDVGIHFPLLGSLWNIGDLQVLGYGWATTLPAVRRPEVYARRIILLGDAALRRQGRSRSTEGAL